VTVDTTNAIKGRPEGSESLAHAVKAQTNGPTSKAFNTIFARAYDAIDGQSCLWAGDDEAGAATEQLVRDAGLEPVRVGDLGSAAALEDLLLNVIFPIAQGRGGPFFYRIEPVG
jgi:predicted dinucleotide-binding enzyme